MEKSEKTTSKRARDEHYILDLCDQVLGLKSIRQHNFDFLKGDPNRRGICRCLPVDAWYPDLNLVIEYCERQHSEPVKFFDKPDRITISGVPRSEQRKIYDERRRTLLPLNNIRLIEISFQDLKHDRRKRIFREDEDNFRRIKEIIYKIMHVPVQH